MLNIHDLKAAYEKAIGHRTSNSTVYSLLARHGWRASTAPSMAAVSPVGNLSVANIPVGSMAAVSPVGNLSAADIPVGSMAAVSPVGNLSAANIPVGSTVAAIITNLWAMVSIATERERQRGLLTKRLSGSQCRRAI
jgi:hypothetical protein